jgi:GTP-binding protein
MTSFERFRDIQFYRSYFSLGELPPSETEVAFFGRSNVGKSSAINAICSRKKLATISKTPGRTRALNFFTVDETKFIVDLPGYGYAKMAKTMQSQIANLLSQYLQKRAALSGIVHVMDVRHPLQPSDREFLSLIPENMPLLILLTKSDKIGTNVARAQLAAVRKELQGEVVLFSSLDKKGLDETRQLLGQWLCL